MAKFGNPFGGNKQVWITQTLHGSSNTAIDCYGYRYQANLPVYAIADGTIIGTSPNSGSYCYQSVNGSDFKVWYVHTHNWSKAGTKVKKGDKICEIAPKSKNGGYPEHLHLGLTPKGTNIMEYFDRTIPFRTKYSDIAKSWFKGDELNWSLFRDLSYLPEDMIKIGDNVKLTADTNLRVGSSTKYDIKAVCKKGSVGVLIGGPRNADGYEWWDIRFLDNQGWMANPLKKRLVKTTSPVTQTDGTIPVVEPVDPCQQYKDVIEQLKTGIETLQEENNVLRIEQGALQKENAEIKARNKTLEDSVAVLEEGLGLEVEEREKLEAQVAVVKDENSRLQREKLELQEKLSKCEQGLEQGQENFITKIKDWIGNLLRGILK